jgi:diguanylate cyclase (GGDEF)-like protein/PAS domain S-box-containing protein
VDSSHDAVMSLDGEGLVTTVSARAEMVLGHSGHGLVGGALSATVVEEAREELDELVRVALGGKDVFQYDTQARRRDRRLIDITIDLAPLRPSRDGSVTGVSVIIQDISARKRLERQLRHQAERDPLTGLYNRRRFEGELYRALRLAQRHDQTGAIVVMDVDRFKAVNDTHGHASGDKLLKDLAYAMRTVLRETDLPARVGGDEFAILLPNVTDGAAVHTAERVLAATRPGVERWEASMSAGVACFGGASGLDAERVVAAADGALYRAKASGGNRVAVAASADGSRPA